MEWYLWVLIGYFGIGILFSLFITILMIARYIRFHKYTKLGKSFYLATIFVWPYLIYAILNYKEATK